MVDTAGKSRKRKRKPVLEPGAALDADLTVVEHLGGSRKVDLYLCRSKRLRKLVSCKVLRPEYCVDFSSLEAVMYEGGILQGLCHPNVVAGLGVALEKRPRIVMQYLKGQNLATTFFGGNYHAFGLSHFISVANQVAEALTYVHAQGYLHLDVKPSNVMYHNGHVTLFDFSVAEEYSPENPIKDNAGTVEYMAPEQTYRREVGYATDVFGLGVLFYQLLTGGDLPYPVIRGLLPGRDGDEHRQLDYRVAPAPPSTINPSVPSKMDTLALKAIRAETAKRHGTPAEVKEELTQTRRELEQ